MIQTFSKAQVLRGLRTVHTWLGVLVVPWIIIIGATGFYLNHSKGIQGWRCKYGLIDVKRPSQFRKVAMT